jgi:hypothetical protein
MPTDEQVLGEIGKDVGDGVIRAAIHRKDGNTVTKGQMTADLPEIEANSKFNEGSVSKVRLGFLGYALDQDQNTDFSLENKAVDIFGQPEFKQYLQDRYGAEKGQVLGSFIDNLFTQGSEQATLGDLLTHRAGVGDLTRDQLRLFQREGIDKQYSLADLLLVEESEHGIKRTDGKPHAQSSPDIPDNELPSGRHGSHQYSNLSYAIAGLAIEYKTGRPLHELHDEYFLHPVKGKAAGRDDLHLDHTIPQGGELVDVASMPTYDHKSSRVVDGAKFNGANAAGGFRTTAEDLTTFMENGFKGFPGTKEYKSRSDNPNQNPYFTDETIDRIMAEGKEFGIAGANPKAGTVDYQMSGFVTTVKVPEGLYIPDTRPIKHGGKGELLEDFHPSQEQLEEMFSENNILKYHKTGGIVGAKTFADFYPNPEKEGVAEVSVFLKEDVTPQIDKLKKEAQNQSEMGNLDEARKMMQGAEDLSSQIGIGREEFLDKSKDVLQSIEQQQIHHGEIKELDQKLGIDKPSWVDRISGKDLDQLKEAGSSLPKLEPAESNSSLSHVERLNAQNKDNSKGR